MWWNAEPRTRAEGQAAAAWLWTAARSVGFALDADPGSTHVTCMALNLLKLCVGAESVEDLQDWITRRLAAQKAAGVTPEQFHTTRMAPKRLAELLDGGSLYWVIKGQVQVRQRLVDIRHFVDSDGISRCNLVLDPALHLTAWQPRRPFQGWRYLVPEDAPPDMAQAGEGFADMPPELRRELASLGLL